MILRLVTNGCSFTYGYELNNVLDAWPYKLGKLLGISVINLAIPGASNDYIVRSIIQNILNETITRNDLLIIGWTGEFRKEFYSDVEHKYISIKNNRTIVLDEVTKTYYTNDYSQDLNSIVNQYFTELYTNRIVAISDKLRQMLLLSKLLNEYDIPYTFFNALGGLALKDFTDSEFKGYDQLNIIRKTIKSVKLDEHILNEYNILYKEIISDGNIISAPSMEEFCKSYPIGKWFHPLEKGHEEWANFLYSKLH